MQNTTNKKTWSFWNPHIWLQFCSIAVGPLLTAWPRYKVSALHCFFIIHSLFSTFLQQFISLINRSALTLSTVVHLALGRT